MMEVFEHDFIQSEYDSFINFVINQLNNGYYILLNTNINVADLFKQGKFSFEQVTFKELEMPLEIYTFKYKSINDCYFDYDTVKMS